MIEPSVIDSNEERFQFEREGYFYKDPIDYSLEKPVFNKIVSLKDSWSKKVKQNNSPKKTTKNDAKKPNKSGEMASLNQEEQKIYDELISKYNLNKQLANILAREFRLYEFFNSALKDYDGAITIANIVANEVSKELKNKSIDDIKFTPSYIASLARLVDEGVISSKIAKDVFEIMSSSGKEPEVIVKEQGLEQISDPKMIEQIVDEVIDNNKKQFEQYKAGNKKLFGFFVGQVLKATNGKANPKIANEIIREKLDK